MIVSRAELERFLGQLERETRRPEHGIFGPRSPMWEVAKEAVAFVGGGRAALLQTAHPYVAQAVSHHSQAQEDLPGRFQRTFMSVFSLVFGDLDEALTAARRLHALHQTVTGHLEEAAGPFPAGHAYAANTEEALLWVHATLTETSLLLYEQMVRPLSGTQREAFYQDTRRFARLFGISDRVLPPDWPAFRRYFDAMLASDTLTVSGPALEIGHFLLTPPRPAVSVPWKMYRAVTAGLLPPRVRDQYGITWRRRDELFFKAAMVTLRRTYRHLPRRLRYLPAYIDARRRIRGRSGPDWFGQLTERAVMSALKPRRATS